MSSHEQKINEYLKTMGFSTMLASVEGGINLHQAIVNHMGLQVGVFLDREFLLVQILLGYVPKINIAPLFRRLLTLNSLMVGAYFGITEPDDGILLRSSRNMEDLDFAEFKLMIDNVGAQYWQHGNNLIQEFQLPTQPS